MTTLVHQQSQTFGAHPHADAPDHEHHHDAGGNTVFGFWIYLMSDCLLFACLFAGYAVLSRNTNGGPTGKEIFDLRYVAVETLLLLLSSITYGMAMMGTLKRNSTKVLLWLAITGLFGLGFGLIWHIWWLAVASFVGMIAAFIVRSFDDDVDYYVPIPEVERIENERHLRLANQG